MSPSTELAVRWTPAAVRRFTGSPRPLLRYLADELAARPQRLARAVRLALMASLGIGVMAAAHVESSLGPYLLWAVAAAPRAMMTPGQAGALIATEGTLLIAAVPLAGILVEAPWFYVPAFAALVATRAFLVKRYNLANAWLLVGITALGTLYSVVFDPEGFGWAAAATFGGAVIAFGTILLFDAYAWPDPAESELLDSVARDLDDLRVGVRLVQQGYFDPAARAALAPVTGRSAMTEFLNLLARVEREGARTSRTAQLLALVTLNERLRMELARLHTLTRARVTDSLRQLLRAEIERALDAIEDMLAALAAHVRAGLSAASDPPASLNDAIATALAELDAHSTALGPHTRPGVNPDELANLSNFNLGLHAFARLLDKTAAYPQLSAGIAGTAAAAPARITDPETVRHALKLGVAMAVMLVIALTSRRPDMTAALWTVLTAGMPSHGATLRKLTLRLVGTLTGGAIAIVAIIVVTPNFDTVVSYMIACFLALIGCAWAAQSSNRINSAGAQAGTAFVLVFAGLSPSPDIYEALWRTWAVLLGVGVTGCVFLVLWPDYASASMLPRLRTLLDNDLQLIPVGAPPPDDATIEALEKQSTGTLGQLLAVADDARLEGPRSRVSADAIIDAAGTLRRIAHRLGWIAGGRAAQPTLSPASAAARRAFEDGLRRRLGAWRAYFAERSPDRSGAAALRDRHRVDDLEQTLHTLVSRIASNSYAEIADWPLSARRPLLAEIDSFERLVVLTGELDQQFAAIMAA